MRNRRSTITEEFSPMFRRRISIGKSNYLNVSMPHLIIADEDGLSVCPSQINEQFCQNQSSISNSPNKKQHEIRVEQYLSDFKFNHSRIHKIIDEVDQYMRKRMDIHETELINVVRKQIDGMMEDSRKVIEHYNRMLEQKNKQTEIYHLQNQLNYFRSASLSLFKQNARIKQESKRALQKARDSELKVQELTYAMTKLTKKYLKSLACPDKNKNLSKKIQNLKNNEEYYIKKYKKEGSPMKSNNQQFLTEIQSKIEEEPSCIIIDIDDKSDAYQKQNIDREEILGNQISKEENQTEVYTQKKSYKLLQVPKFSKYSKTPRPILYSRQQRVSFSKLASPMVKNSQFMNTKKRIFSANKKKTTVKNVDKDRRRTEIDPNKSEKSLGTALSLYDKNCQSNTKMEMKLSGAAIKLESKNVSESREKEFVEKRRGSRRKESFWKIRQYNTRQQGK